MKNQLVNEMNMDTMHYEISETVHNNILVSHGMKRVKFIPHKCTLPAKIFYIYKKNIENYTNV